MNKEGMTEMQSLEQLLATIYRMNAIEHKAEGLKVQARRYAFLRENDKQLRSLSNVLTILEITKFIEFLYRKEFSDNDTEKKIKYISERYHLIYLEITALWSIVLLIAGLLIGALFVYVTHVLH